MYVRRITALVLISLLGSTAEARLLPGSIPAAQSVRVMTGMALTTMQSLTVTAGTINATNPQALPSPTTPVTVSWQQSLADKTGWTLMLQVPSQTMLNGCTASPAVPVTAIRVTCNSVTSTAGAGWTGSCQASNLTLSPGQTYTIASGDTGNKNTPANVTVNLTYTFADDFKYVPTSSCTLPLTYSVSG